MDEIAIDRAIWESPVTWKRKRKNIMEKSEIAAPIFPYIVYVRELTRALGFDTLKKAKILTFSKGDNTVPFT